MERLDNFLHFFIDHIDDSRISVFKKIKYGYRYYYISFYIDDDPNQNTQNQNYGFKYRENLEITFDNISENQFTLKPYSSLCKLTLYNFSNFNNVYFK